MQSERTSPFAFHYADRAVIPAPPAELFAFLDRHSQLSAHMTRRSWMMGGGRMSISADEGQFQRLGSRLRLAGRVFGLQLFLEEEVTARRPPQAKTWRTIGTPRLLIIGHYEMGFEVSPAPGGCSLRVFLNYNLPPHTMTRLLGRWLAPSYARWCVRSMIAEGQRKFSAGADSEQREVA